MNVTFIFATLNTRHNYGAESMIMVLKASLWQHQCNVVMFCIFYDGFVRHINYAVSTALADEGGLVQLQLCHSIT